MTGRTATLIGATGLIGSHLLQLLEADNYFSTIRLLVRRPFKASSSRTEVKLVDFADHESYRLGIYGSDAVFCAVGTTQKKVKGDMDAYRRVDYDIPVRAAQFCALSGCRHFSLVSSVGANSSAGNFYLKLKGEVEDEVRKQSIQSIAVFRPSILLGNRNESRPAERIGQIAMQALSFAFVSKLSKYKPIHAHQVASAMLHAAKEQSSGFKVYEYGEIRKLFEV
ncbi:MAG TPA: NAD(P)H-binding protein [Flavisolibacter sp.]|jgi:uncharacterized protein YbjT (DUF2867 family)